MLAVEYDGFKISLHPCIVDVVGSKKLVDASNLGLSLHALSAEDAKIIRVPS